MRARTINFERGLDPKDAMSIGNSAYRIVKQKPIKDKYDSSFFSLKLSTGADVAAMGDEFNPDNYNMTLPEMLKFIDKGIQTFLNSPKSKFSWAGLGHYVGFFESEFNDDDGMGLPETLTKEYVVGKLVCGKENAKSI